MSGTFCHSATRVLVAVGLASAVCLAVLVGPAAEGREPSMAHAVASSSDRVPKVMTEYYGTFRVRPSMIILTGDGSNVFGRTLDGRGFLRWGKWTRRVALGEGTIWWGPCNPTCADARLKSSPGVIRLSNPRAGKFRTMVIRFRKTGRVFYGPTNLHKQGEYYQW